MTSSQVKDLQVSFIRQCGSTSPQRVAWTATDGSPSRGGAPRWYCWPLYLQCYIAIHIHCGMLKLGMV
uniref:Uncharacterized protein n=1 Tax=Hordeum vulgare subsp. vulgare TaxID=112509 RepID=A0A8I6XFS7_HORVV